ncbi:M50 family metallopeptidase [Miltoncostaea oceani]|uniref:M50 family metallopeptidase n=1 Tax=Miltoncostaea oceani TaxID=2843216 RepID=UPI001C3E672D|nr:M50 family metallopeptidase [Miltoncostaea oceani]
MQIAIFIFALMTMIILHECGHFVAAKLCGMRVEKFFLFFGRPLISKTIGETQYGIGWLPAGGFVKISGMTRDEEIPEELRGKAYYAAPTWKRLVVIFAGPAVNIVCAFALFFAFYMDGVPRVENRIAEVTPASAAASVGIMEGDLLIAVNEAQVSGNDPRSLQQELVESAGAEATITILRDGSERSLDVVLDGGEGQPALGVVFATRNQSLGFTRSLSASGLTMIEQTKIIGASMAELLHSSEAREQLTTIVGITAYYEEAEILGLALFYIASISFLLGLFNLIPLLPLDGGHIVIAVVEKVRGGPFSARVYTGAALVGIAIMMLGMVFGISNDIGRITGEGFQLE